MYLQRRRKNKHFVQPPLEGWKWSHYWWDQCLLLHSRIYCIALHNWPVIYWLVQMVFTVSLADRWNIGMGSILFDCLLLVLCWLFIVGWLSIVDWLFVIGWLSIVGWLFIIGWLFFVGFNCFFPLPQLAWQTRGTLEWVQWIARLPLEVFTCVKDLCQPQLNLI